MKQKLFLFTIYCTTLCALTSCLKSSDNDGIIYHDAAITAFSVGTLKYNRLVNDKRGNDSIAHTTLNGATYRFYIDQLRHEIYNADSLPYGVDAKKVVCSLAAKNGGVVVYQPAGSTEFKYFSTNDSIDFTQPRTFRVYSPDGSSAYNDYTIRVNVRRYPEGRFAWNATAYAASALQGLTMMKAVALNHRLFVMGFKNGQAHLYATANNQPTGWSELTMNVVMGETAVNSLTTDGQHLFTYSNGGVYRSTDGQTWQLMGTPTLQQIAGYDDGKLYAVGAGALLVSADNGANWTAETLQDNSNDLPQSCLHLLSFASRVNAHVHNLVLIGNPATSVSTGAQAQLWSTTLNNAAATHAWSYYGEAKSAWQAPRLAQLQVVKIGENLIAFGGQGLGTNTQTAFKQFYVSGDQGLTWHQNADLKKPTGFENNELAAAIALDDEQNVWLITSKTGKVWKTNTAGLRNP